MTLKTVFEWWSNSIEGGCTITATVQLLWASREGLDFQCSLPLCRTLSKKCLCCRGRKTGLFNGWLFFRTSLNGNSWKSENRETCFKFTGKEDLPFLLSWKAFLVKGSGLLVTISHIQIFHMGIFLKNYVTLIEKGVHFSVKLTVSRIMKFWKMWHLPWQVLQNGTVE